MIKPDTPKDKKSRSELINQMMLRIAELLPPEYRGIYPDVESISTELISPCS